MPAHVKQPAPTKAPQGSSKERSAPASTKAPARDPEALPAVLSQTSRMHKVMAAVNGDDEFSVFSTSPVARQKNPVDMKPEATSKEKVEGGGKLIRFFRGLIGG